MKNFKAMNPIVLARNSIAATSLLTVLNIVVVALHFPPIFPLSMSLPVTAGYYFFNTPQVIVDIFGSLESYNESRPVFLAITIIMIVPVVYAYFRSAKKPSAIKIAFWLLVIDTVVLGMNFSFSISFVIEILYHGVLLYYIFKGVRALKGAKDV